MHEQLGRLEVAVARATARRMITATVAAA